MHAHHPSRADRERARLQPGRDRTSKHANGTSKAATLDQLSRVVRVSHRAPLDGCAALRVAVGSYRGTPPRQAGAPLRGHLRGLRRPPANAALSTRVRDFSPFPTNQRITRCSRRIEAIDAGLLHERRVRGYVAGRWGPVRAAPVARPANRAALRGDAIAIRVVTTIPSYGSAAT